MENYTRVPKAKSEESISPNEIRITSTGKSRRYISYSVALLDPTLLQQDDEHDKEVQQEQQQQKDQKIYDSIVLKGMGQAINKTVTIAEVIKRRVAGLHQLNEIHSTTITDEWEPKEEGLEKHSTTRTVSAISITLSKKPLNVNDPGYQAPIAADLVQPMQQAIPKKRRTTKDASAEESGEAAATTSDDNKEAKQRRKKKPQQRRKKSDQKKNGDDETEQQQQQQQQDSNEAEDKPKSDKPKRGKPRKTRVNKDASTVEESNEESSGNNAEESGSRGKKSGRGGTKRYRGGYKKNRGGNDQTQQGEVSDSVTSSSATADE